MFSSSKGQKRPLRELSDGTDDDHDTEDKPHLEDTVTARSLQRRSWTEGEQQDNFEHEKSLHQSLYPPTSFRRLRLEAIFYPKFDNEKQQSEQFHTDNSSELPWSIRQQMKENIQQELGYLEVTLKHSGSLLLWSGGTRYYSKNGTDNVFTMVGELIVQQHFYRAWYKHDDDNNNKKTSHDCSDFLAYAMQGETMYQACSDYLEQHRLTLAMELVTAVLGDHGAVPIRDYIIVTALARRDCYRLIHPRDGDNNNVLTPQSWFASTPELIKFCQRFRLPHNDVWICTSVSTVNKLLNTYDQLREDGTAANVIPAITDIADLHVASMHPHEAFQGDILEGLVARYVPYEQQQQLGQQDLGHPEATQPVVIIEQMQLLAKEADEVRQNVVPATRPPSHQLFHGFDKSIASIDLRQVFATCNGSLSALDAALRNIFLHGATSDNSMNDDANHNNSTVMPRRSIKRVANSTSSNFPLWVQPLTESPDMETRRIAELIEKLQRLNARVEYHVLREETKSESSQSRWLCIIHVLHDTTFVKYHSSLNSGDMALFRGFCVEFGDLEEDEERFPDCATELNRTTSPDLHSMSPDLRPNSDHALMLKMKLLPYMVRTFVCRNGLGVIKQRGSLGFHKFCVDMLNQWRISETSQLKWIPFFQAWCRYVEEFRPKQDNEWSTSYLQHLERFSKLYESKTFTASTCSDCTFRGLVVVVVALDETRAKRAAGYLATALGGPKVIYDINTVTTTDVLLAKAPGNGFVCGTVVTHWGSRLQNLLNVASTYFSLLVFGCSEHDIASLDVANNEKKKINGMLTKWRSFHQTVELDESSIPVSIDEGQMHSPTDAFVQYVERLQATSRNLPEYDCRHGLVVFFPGIPGCGKSTLCSNLNSKLRKRLSQETPTIQNNSEVKLAERPKDRNVIVRSGDATKQNFWDLVQEERADDRSSVYIADKNAPPTWDRIGQVCASTKGIAVPVVFDGVLQTTVIMSKSDARMASEVYPFSLRFLAVCMARVLDRPSGSHQGKLDRGIKNALSVVLQFFTSYRGIKAENFRTMLKRQLESQGAIMSQSIITIPFFLDECNLEGNPELPKDLEELLEDSLRIQPGRTPKKIKQNDELEERLEATITKYRDQLLSTTVDATAAQNKLIEQLCCVVRQVDLLPLNVTGEPSTIVKIVSIDLDRDEVISFINENADKLSSFMGQVKQTPPSKKTSDHVESEIDFVQHPHVTMCHCNDVEQSFIHEKFDHLRDKSVDVEVTGLLWSKEIAALAVVLPYSTTDGHALPPSKNKFVHVTLWHLVEVEAYISNKLPGLVDAGRAQRICFDRPTILHGKLTFWDASKH